MGIFSHLLDPNDPATWEASIALEQARNAQARYDAQLPSEGNSKADLEIPDLAARFLEVLEHYGEAFGTECDTVDVVTEAAESKRDDRYDVILRFRGTHEQLVSLANTMKRARLW